MNKYAIRKIVSDATEPHSEMRLLDSQYDNLFKAIISAGWNVKSDGDVEAPSGFFALVEVPDHPGELSEMQDAVGDETIDDEWPDCGWYVTREDSDGLIFVYEQSSQRVAETAYDKLQDDFLDWADDDNENGERE